MATFLQNLAPAVSAISGGYLKGQAETQEKARTEQLELDKTALSTYYKLLESGHFDAVDPIKGVPEGQVIKVGGMFLVPKSVEQDPRYARDIQAMKYQTEQHAATMQDREESRADRLERLKREAEIHGLNLNIAKEHLATAKERTTQVGEKKDKTKLTIYNPIDNTILAENVDADEVEKLLKDFKEKKGFPSAKIGKPSAAYEKPLTEPQQLKIDVDSVRARRKLIKDAEEAKSDEEGQAITGDANKILRDNDTFAYAWKSGNADWYNPFTWVAGKKMAAVDLPTLTMKNGSKVQMSIGDVKALAKRNGLTFEQQIAILLKPVKR